jgi:hypothetical protein
MANAKKAPQVPAVTPKAKPIRKDVEPNLIVKGHEKEVDLIVQKTFESKEASKVIDQVRGNAAKPGLDALATEFRSKHEADGEFTKTVIVAGTNQNAVYTFKDSYAKIDTAVEPDLKRLLGNEYTELFQRVTSVSVKKGCEDRLLELARQHGFIDLLDPDEYICAVDGFREKRAEKRSALSTEQNNALDSVVSQTASKPTLNLK